MRRREIDPDGRTPEVEGSADSLENVAMELPRQKSFHGTPEASRMEIG